MISQFCLLLLLALPVGSIADTQTIKKLNPLQNAKQLQTGRRPASAVNLINVKPLTGLTPLVISPKIPMVVLPRPKGPTFFKLDKIPSKNQLVISFISTDEQLKLDTTAPLAIQLNTEYPLQINPPLIIGSTWPKTGNSVLLNFSNATQRIQNKITGKASYSYCNAKTKQCKAVLDPLEFYFIP